MAVPTPVVWEGCETNDEFVHSSCHGEMNWKRFGDCEKESNRKKLFCACRNLSFARCDSNESVASLFESFDEFSIDWIILSA